MILTTILWNQHLILLKFKSINFWQNYHNSIKFTVNQNTENSLVNPNMHIVSILPEEEENMSGTKKIILSTYWIIALQFSLFFSTINKITTIIQTQNPSYMMLASILLKQIFIHDVGYDVPTSWHGSVCPVCVTWFLWALSF